MSNAAFTSASAAEAVCQDDPNSALHRSHTPSIDGVLLTILSQRLGMNQVYRRPNILALLLFGPKKLPELARQLGKLMADFRRASNEFRTQMAEELRISELLSFAPL